MLPTVHAREPLDRPLIAVNKAEIGTEPGTTSLFLTVANSVKTVLGGGILSLSWAWYYGTFWPGVFVTVGMALLSAHSFAMLGICSEITGERSFTSIWLHAFGKRWVWIPDVVTFVFCSMAVVSFLIIIGDYLPRGLYSLGIEWSALQYRQVSILIVQTVLLPMIFLADLSFLAYTSVIGTLGSFLVCGTLLAMSVYREDQTLAGASEPSGWQPCELTRGIFVMIPAVAFAFNGHFNVPAIYQSLEHRSPARWTLVTASVFLICFIVILIAGGAGYVMLGKELVFFSDALSAPSLQGRPAVEAACLAMTLSVSCGLPLYVQAAREALDGLWLRNAPARLRAAGARASYRRRQSLLSALIAFCTVSLSMVCTDLGIINDINGSVCACLQMFVFPSLMYYKCVEGTSFSSPLTGRWMPRLNAAIGATVGTAGVISSLVVALESKGS
eukprot:gnl/TRDRNA2_/TRDRNA2_68143_c0_seq1.p1 gnl/TRDRNA2_/TRDRNA2_68143_c0~~gnl/TRDRNA2_/TRDRNA2_68143_c0_seq1.p1  ORF type:complete len:477 (+),score=37.74 gnl/TRDRNA2_/TRDRNA2_68143_c0_seq1:100-1431(+)